MSAPRVTLLPPRPGLDNAHHGPAQASGIKLFDTPTQFHNPWKSFRMATPTDIWTAYQKGAAVAPAQSQSCCSTPPAPSAPSADAGPARSRASVATGTGTSANASASEATLVPDAASERTAVNNGNGRKDKADADGTVGTADAAADDDEEDPTPTYAEEAGDTLHAQHPPEDITCYIRPELKDMASSDEADDWREPPLRVVRPAWAPAFAPSVTWLGHASVLLRIPWAVPPGADPVSNQPPGDMCGVLFDPIFSARCSPVQSFGPQRYLDPPCAVDQLPPIHAVLISHDHYDHLDYNTVLDLWAFHHRTVHFFVPLGLAKWFHQCGVPEHRVSELDWWHETLVTFPAHPGPQDFDDGEGGGDGDGDGEGGAEGGGEAEAEGDGEGEGEGERRGDAAKDTEDTVPGAWAQHPPPPARVNVVDADAEVDRGAALSLKIALTPAQHRSGRGLFDQMTTLWGSWVIGVISPEQSEQSGTAHATHAAQTSPDPLQPGMQHWRGFKAFFGGDTGYRYAGADADDAEAVCPAFREIAELYGPFDLALLPLSTGSSLPFLRKTLNLSLDQYTMTSAMHCSPEDSVAIHKLLPARRSFGIHWGTFSDVSETRASRVTFGRARRDAGLSKNWPDRNCFVIADIGETLVMPKDD